MAEQEVQVEYVEKPTKESRFFSLAGTVLLLGLGLAWTIYSIRNAGTLIGWERPERLGSAMETMAFLAGAIGACALAWNVLQDAWPVEFAKGTRVDAFVRLCGMVVLGGVIVTMAVFLLYGVFMYERTPRKSDLPPQSGASGTITSGGAEEPTPRKVD